jgi:hypothetical protein
MTHEAPQATPAIGLSLTHTVAENRNIVMQAFVPFDCAPAELNGALDKMFLASERQQAKVRLPQAKKDLIRLQKAYERACEDIIRLDAEGQAANSIADQAYEATGRRGARPSTAAMKQDEARRSADRANTETSLKRGKQDITLLQEEIAELDAIVNGTPED